MNDDPKTLLPKCGSGSTGRSQLLVFTLILACLTTHGIGVNLLVGAFARITLEEITEESKCQVVLRVASPRCSHVRWIKPRGEPTISSARGDANSGIKTPRPAACFAAQHLIGAGIRVRC